jgi:hypothetical protein
MPGHWRREPIVVSQEIEHVPTVCGACQGVLGAGRKGRQVSAHNVLELICGSMALQVIAIRHRYFAAWCDCGHEAIAAPGVGLYSAVEGRKRDLQMSERCLVGPMLATFIAGLSLRLRLSRLKIAEFLRDWLGLELGVATINRCVHEALAETINGLFKVEVIHRRGPWRNAEAVEFATLEWVAWFNNRRLLEPIGNIPPAEAEARYYEQRNELAMVA